LTGSGAACAQMPQLKTAVRRKVEKYFNRMVNAHFFAGEL